MRDAALIAVVGIGLGLTYNHAMLLAHDDRALTWVAKERSTGVLDLATPAAAGDATPAAGSAPATPATSTASTMSAADAPASASTTSETKPTAHDTTHAKKGSTKSSSTKKGTTAKAAPATSTAKAAPAAGASSTHGTETTEGGAKAPATAGGAASSPAAAGAGAAAANVPAIPDTKEPLEANYSVIKALHDADAALFVDARSAEEYAAGHIPGAISMPFDDVFKKPELAKNLDSQGKPIVTYCDGGDCELSKDLAFSLIDNGHKKVVFFKDGLPGWKSAGNPVNTGSKP